MWEARVLRPPRDTLGFLAADVSRLMRRAFAERLTAGPLTLAQARALVYVSRHEGVRQVELAALLEVQPITLARLVDQLEKAGLVERRPDAADRRAYRVHLKPSAHAQLAEIARVAAAVRTKAMAGMNKKEAEAVMAGLKRMRDNLA